MIMEEEKPNVPTCKEMSEIIIEIKNDTKQIIKNMKKEEKDNDLDKTTTDKTTTDTIETICVSILYDPCFIKSIILLLIIVVFVIVVKVVNNG